MATTLKLRRGTTAQHSTFTGAVGEVTADTDKDTLVVHDGVTAGGFPVMSTKGPQTLDVNSSSDALRITQTGTGNALVVEDSTNPDSTPFVVTSGGDVIIGGTAGIPSYQYSNPQLFVFGGSSGGQKAGQYTAIFSNDIYGPSVELGKSRSTTIGTAGTIVQNGDELGIISFNGDDGTDLRTPGATIRAQVDGTPGTNDMPGRLVFSTTADGASSPTERMRIDSAGNVGIGTSSPGSARLAVNSGSGGLMGSWNSTNANGGYVTFSTSGTYYGDIGTAAQTVSGSASDFAINARGSRNFVFGTANTERARIDSSGSLRLGTTSDEGITNKFTVRFTGGGTEYGIVMRPNNDNTVPIYFQNASSGSVGYIYTSASSTTYNTSSDYRLKNTIAPMTGALAKVALLKPCTYKWNADGSDGEGFIAHELAEVVPQCVTGEKDAVDADGNPVYQGIDTSFLVATLTAAIQEQQAIIETLKADVAALKGN